MQEEISPGWLAGEELFTERREKGKRRHLSALDFCEVLALSELLLTSLWLESSEFLYLLRPRSLIGILFELKIIYCKYNPYKVKIFFLYEGLTWLFLLQNETHFLASVNFLEKLPQIRLNVYEYRAKPIDRLRSNLRTLKEILALKIYISKVIKIIFVLNLEKILKIIIQFIY